jgi:hypothetical protein
MFKSHPIMKNRAGLVFHDLPDTATSTRARLSVIFYVLLVFQLLPFSFMSFFVADRSFFLADVTTNLYTPSAYFVANSLASESEFPLCDFSHTALVLHLPTGLNTMLCRLPIRDSEHGKWISYSLWAFWAPIGHEERGTLCRDRVPASPRLPTIAHLLRLGDLQSGHTSLTHIPITQSAIFRELKNEQCFCFLQDMAYVLSTGYVAFCILLSGFFIRIKDVSIGFIKALSWASYPKFSMMALARLELIGRNYSDLTCKRSASNIGGEPICSTVNLEIEGIDLIRSILLILLAS